MENYLDKIMSNHVFNSESDEDLSYLYSDEENERGQNGGADNSTPRSKEVPNGGFPPIRVVSEKEREEEKSKNRQLSGTNRAGISIKDILKSKK